MVAVSDLCLEGSSISKLVPSSEVLVEHNIALNLQYLDIFGVSGAKANFGSPAGPEALRYSAKQGGRAPFHRLQAGPGQFLAGTLLM